MKRAIQPILICFLFITLPFIAFAKIEMPELFADHMVLQRQLPIPVWGKAAPNTQLQISLNQTKLTTRSDYNGTWMVKLPAQEAGGPFELKIQSSTESIILKDVLIGEVWLCSGQSNMEWPLSKTANGEQAISQADNSQIRFFRLKKKHDTYKTPYSPKELIEFTKGAFFYPTAWEKSTSKTAAVFSGVGYFFGKELYDSLQVPIGLIQNAVGGSPAQSWISQDALALYPQLESLVKDSEKTASKSSEKNKNWLDSDIIHPWLAERANQNWAGWDRTKSKDLPGHPFAPSYLYDNAIKPLAPYAMRGVIWYQGESNATHPSSYFTMSKALVDCWRKLWGQGDFPFYFVQLPRIANRRLWPEFRAAQEAVLQLNNTAMAVSIDEGEELDVHPKRKKVIGHRLARLALKRNYGKAFLITNPSFSHYQWSVGAEEIQLYFNSIGEGLSTKDNSPAQGFRLQGYAKNGTEETILKAEIISITKNKISIRIPKDFILTKVKYAWAPFPKNNIINSAALPLAPFKIEILGVD